MPIEGAGISPQEQGALQVHEPACQQTHSRRLPNRLAQGVLVQDSPTRRIHSRQEASRLKNDLGRLQEVRASRCLRRRQKQLRTGNLWVINTPSRIRKCAKYWAVSGRMIVPATSVAAANVPPRRQKPPEQTVIGD